MCLNSLRKCVIIGLLVSLAGVEVINEAKTYTKEISTISDLGKDDQVIIKKGDVLIAQYICHAGNCTCTPNTVGQLTEQLGYLVLTMQNISSFDRFDAFKWDVSGKHVLLKDFTLNEVPSTSTTPTLAEAHNQRQSLTEPTNMTDTTKALIGVGVGVVLALAAVVAIIVDLKSGRDGRIARAITFFRRRSCNLAPNQHDEDSTEMQSLAAPV